VVKKPILKLTYKDYIENSLGELLEQGRAYDQINIDVFNDLQHTITGVGRGGKPNADDSTRPVPSSPFPTGDRLLAALRRRRDLEWAGDVLLRPSVVDDERYVRTVRYGTGTLTGKP